MFSAFDRSMMHMLVCMSLPFMCLADFPSAAAESISPSASVTFRVEQPTYASVVVDDLQGRRVANLASDRWFEAGEHTLTWSGYGVERLARDPDKPWILGEERVRLRAQPGQYKVRALTHDGVKLIYEFSVQSPGDPPWHTLDRSGAWLADHTPPAAALSLPYGSPYGDQPQIMVCAPTGETGHSIMWLTLDGRKLYGSKMSGWRSASVLAADQGASALPEYYAYGLVQDRIMALHRKHGTNHHQSIARSITDEIRRDVPGDEPTFNWQQRTLYQGLAVHNGIALVSHYQANALSIHDLRGKQSQQHIGDVSIARPAGLAFDTNGRLYVVSNHRLLRFDYPDLTHAELGKPAVLVDHELTSPGRLLLHDDAIFIADQADRQQVKVFDLEGRLLRTIGKAGGPKLGPYDERRMHRPAGMAVDAHGKLWVAELDYGPKRISRWDAKTGNFDRAFYGPPRYGGGGSIDPVDKTRFYYMGVEYRLDWVAGSAKPAAIYTRMHYGPDFPGVMTVPGRQMPDRAMYHQGRRYLINAYNGELRYHGTNARVWLMGEDHIARSVGTVEVANHRQDKGGWPLMVARGEDPQWKDRLNGYSIMAWTDTSGDRFMQDDEVSWLNFPNKGAERKYHRWQNGWTFGPDLSVLSSRGFHVPAPKIKDDGTPEWDLSQGRYLLPLKDRAIRAVSFLSSDNTVVRLSDAKGQTAFTGLRDGQTAWAYALTGAEDGSGVIVRPNRPLGPLFSLHNQDDLGEMLAVNGDRGSVYLFTTDGYLITELGGDQKTHPLWRFPKAQRGMEIKDATFQDEHFKPTLTATADGNVYLIAGKEHASILRVEGLETIERRELGHIALTPAMLAQKHERMTRPLHAPRVDPLNVSMHDSEITVDGHFADWPASSSWVAIDEHASASMLITSDKIFLGYRTSSSNTLGVRTDDLRYLFKYGGSLDLMLRTDPQAKESAKPVPGDVRLLVSRQSGKTLAVLYRQAMKKPSPTAYTFTSPVGTVKFDAVDVVSDHVVLAEDGKGGYELSLSRDLIDFEPEHGQTYRGDLGLIRGKPGESRQRVYWSNKDTSLMSDIPTEARLVPHQWGELRVVSKNIAKDPQSQTEQNP